MQGIASATRSATTAGLRITRTRSIVPNSWHNDSTGAMTVQTPGGMTLEDWQVLCPALRVIRARDKSVIYAQGETCTASYLIARGHIKLSRVSAQGNEHTMAILPADDVCGASLAGDERLPATDTATAKGPTQLYCIPQPQFAHAVAREPRAAAFVVERLARRQAFLASRVEQLLNGDVRSRVAAVLAELIGAYGGRCTHGHEVDIRLTQQELAEMTGASRPTVSTILNRMRDQGVVSYTRHYICVENRRALEQLSAPEDDAR